MDIVTGIGIFGAVVATVDCLKDINPLYRKKKAEMDIYIDIFKKQLTESLEEIPEENRQKPKNSIIWPAFESSIFYLEEEAYRRMFSNLIVSACDNRQNDNIHIYFTELIKQLESIDAVALSSFKNKSNKAIVNILYKVTKENKTGEAPYATNIFIIEGDNQKIDKYSTSISNLCRLGLLSTSYTTHLMNDEEYKIYENHPEFISLKNHFEDELQSADGSQLKIFIQKGAIEVTPLGHDFIKVCIE